MMFLVIQGGFAAILVVLALLAGSTRDRLLNLATLLVPLGWGWITYDNFRRDERARKDGAWSPAFAAKESKRGFGLMGIVIVAWVALGIAIFLLA